MNCPLCQVQMKRSRVGKTTINECHQCNGIWFAYGDLSAIKDEVLPDMKWLDIDAWKKHTGFIHSWTSILCPNCRDFSLAILRDRESVTEIAICAQCRGAWLGPGQFLNLINALLEEANQKSIPEYVIISLQQIKELLSGDDPIALEWQRLKTVLGLIKQRIFMDHPMVKRVIYNLKKSLPI